LYICNYNLLKKPSIPRHTSTYVFYYIEQVGLSFFTINIPYGAPSPCTLGITVEGFENRGWKKQGLRKMPLFIH